MAAPLSSVHGAGPAPARLPIDWGAKLRHFIFMLGFCLAISLLHYAFLPERPYAPALTYSLAIGLSSWFLIDFGRHLFAVSARTGWPPGAAGVLLMIVGNLLGFLLGTLIATEICTQLGWFAATRTSPPGQLRNSLLISLVAGLIGSYYFYSRGKGDYLQRRVGEAERHATEARLKLLETQLEPHMLFNTLANLRALIAVDPDRAQQMLDHMIAYLRATLDGSRATTHRLDAEFERLRDYLALMAIRMGPRLTYALELPPELAAQPVPALLLQPLVENSIQHGLEPQVAGGRVEVSARREAGRLVLEVRDTGAGVARAPAAGGGFGLQQVRERLAAMHGPAAGIEFDSAPGAGARTRITLPLQP